MADDDAFESVVGGSLKLKGFGVQKKKKKKSKESKEVVERAIESAAPQPTGRVLTPAEQRFEEIRKKRQAEKAAKVAAKSHKERVAEFNEYLGKLSEHHDIPKVGPG
ncbi:hypothetical protein HDU96_006086 [Phlyctochytrium bullatum]|nr:hypothetical protein HDU96_006086 [Phlyctochytrium bullatum]